MLRTIIIKLLSFDRPLIEGYILTTGACNIILGRGK